MTELQQKSEKHIEFIELLFDLMFVYLIRCNDELLASGGSFFTPEAAVTYLLSTLVLLQIWLYTTLYIDRLGKGSLADYIFFFTNMYLLYYIGTNTIINLADSFVLYHVAWALILFNFVAQYIRLLLRSENRKGALGTFLRSRLVLFSIQAVAVLLTILWKQELRRIGMCIPLAIGFLGPAFTRKPDSHIQPSFAHLAERARELVLISFGEIIISIAGFFADDFGPREVYFSVCAFLIVIALLFIYGYMYMYSMDRHHCRHWRLFMFLHLFVIIAVNNVSISFRITQNPANSRHANHIYMHASLLGYYIMLYLITRVDSRPDAPPARFPMPAAILSAGFAIVMIVWYQNAWLTGAVTVLYTFLMFASFAKHWKPEKREASRQSPATGRR